MASLFHQGHYNVIAARIRECAIPRDAEQREKMILQNSMLLAIAIELAKEFHRDNAYFDPVKFLDACSPDPEVMPFGEAWEVE